MLLKIWLLFLVIGKSYSSDNCLPPFLANGRGRLSLSGGNIRFNCRKGYQLMGPKYVHCVRGSWDSETPVCIKPGCKWNRNDYFNGLLLESYRGALVKVECYPGYTTGGPKAVYCDGLNWNGTFPECNRGLIKDECHPNYTTGGPKAVYCDGLNWNGTFPECNPMHDEPSKSCDFEDDDFCGWIHDPGNKGYNWKLKSSPTGRFIYLDASNVQNSVNITSRIYSPVYPPDFTSSLTCFSFRYFMQNPNVGLLKVYLLLQGHVVEETIPDFWIQGDQGSEWHRAQFPIERPGTHFQIVIEGLNSAGGHEIAVDDVNIGFDSECEEKTTTEEDFSTTTDAFDTADDFTCQNRCGQSAILMNTNTVISFEDLDEEMKCDCHEKCLVSGTCCPNYLEFCYRPGVSPQPNNPVSTTEFIFPISTKMSTSRSIQRLSTIKRTTTSTTEITVAKIPVKSFENPILQIRKTPDSTVHEAIHLNEPQTNISLSYVVELCLGVAAGVLVLAATVTFLLRRRRWANEHDNNVEDSDVRLLTSDEFLDFTLARPSD